MPDTKLPILAIDFSKDVDHNVFYPLTDASMSNALGGAPKGWTAEKVRIVNAQHPIMSMLPRKCPGYKDCNVALECAFAEDVVEREFKGCNCPIEVVEAFKLFAGYVLDLDIQPEDFTDLQLVMDLVRLSLLIRRCDHEDKDGIILVDEVTMVNQKTGNEVKKKVSKDTFRMMREIREDIKNIYTMLVASRESKIKRDATLGETKSASDLFARITKAAASAGILEEKKQKKLPVINADYKVKEIEDEQEQTD